MDTTDLVPLIEQLDDNIDDLEEVLDPILKGPLSATAGKLPLLDKAHLYVLVTYAIESILFSYLRLNGVNAKEHPIFRELTRVKQYFEKIKAVESAGTAPNAKLDKAAAGRFIKHALAGNQKHDANIAQQQTMRRAAVHVRFEDKAERPKANDGETIGSKITALDDQSKSENSYAAVPTQMTNAVRETSPEDSAADSTTNESRKRNIRSDDSEAAEGLPKSEGESKKDRKKKKKLLRQKKALENA